MVREAFRKLYARQMNVPYLIIMMSVSGSKLWLRTDCERRTRDCRSSHDEMSSPYGELPRFFRKQAKDYAESNGNPCGFFVHRNASSHSELTFYSQSFGNIDGRLISTEYPEPRTS